MAVIRLKVIDGSFGEGGGQILRTSVALSAVTGEPIKIVKIRENRPNPGLRPQHLTGIKVLADLTRAKVSGLRVGSREVEFSPNRIGFLDDVKIDIGTAGSISLLMQSLLPALAFSEEPCSLKLIGGTDVKWSPPIDYMREVLLRLLMEMGFNFKIDIKRRGYYPKGGGIVYLRTNPVEELKEIKKEKFGTLKRIEGRSHCGRLPRHVAERQANSARDLLSERGYPDPEIEIEVSDSLCPGSGITIWGIGESIIGGDSIGERGKRAEIVGKEAAKKFVSAMESGAALDEHMGDNLIPWMGLARGKSRITVSRITKHTLTNIKVTEEILGVEFKVVGKEGDAGTIEVKGMGFKA
ncbi:RNA 3'-phosphate cyclase [Thermococci archaeon]|nr:MAG: RNA 3'-phosphate cyclase [Thermococci archaeon]